MSVPLWSCQIRLARTSGLSGSHTWTVMGRSGSTQTAWKRGIIRPNKIGHFSSIPSQACPKATKKGRISDARLSAVLCQIQNDKSLTDPSYAVNLDEPGTSWLILVKHITARTHTKRERQSSNCKASGINHGETRCLCHTTKKGRMCQI